MKKIFSGTNLEELDAVLEKLQKSSRQICNNYRYTLNISKPSDVWTLEGKVIKGKKRTNITGGSLRKLLSDLSTAQEEDVNDERFVILAHLDTDPEIREGMYHTRWYVVDPIISLEDCDEYGAMPIKSIDATKEEFNALVATRLALYDESENVIYAIEEKALTSVGTLTGASVLYRKLDQKKSVLGPAIILADAISDAYDLSIMYESLTERVSTITAFVNGNNESTLWKKYVHKVVTECDNRVSCTVNNYTVMENEIIIDLDIPFSLAKLKIGINMLPGKADYAILYIEIGNVPVYLKVNKLRQEKRAHPELLFDGMSKEVDRLNAHLDRIAANGARVPDFSEVVEKIDTQNNWNTFIPEDDPDPFESFQRVTKAIPNIRDAKKLPVYSALGKVFYQL